MNCMIVDDEPMARKVLEEYIGDTAFLRLAGVAGDTLKAEEILGRLDVDLLFLDINMPRRTGIDFLKQAPDLPMAILTTAYSQYALEGYELDVLDYLVKPFSYERFLKAVQKAKDYLELRNRPEQVLQTAEPYFFVKCTGRIEKVTYQELVYVEARMNYVILHTDTRNLMVYLTLKSVENQLPRPAFLKVHKSTIVNIARIKSIEGNVLHLDSAEVAISQSLYDTVLAEIVERKLLKR